MVTRWWWWYLMGFMMVRWVSDRRRDGCKVTRIKKYLSFLVCVSISSIFQLIKFEWNWFLICRRFIIQFVFLNENFPFPVFRFSSSLSPSPQLFLYGRWRRCSINTREWKKIPRNHKTQWFVNRDLLLKVRVFLLWLKGVKRWNDDDGLPDGWVVAYIRKWEALRLFFLRLFFDELEVRTIYEYSKRF